MVIDVDKLDNIGIIGTGIVGFELYDYFKGVGQKVLAYDTDPSKGHDDCLCMANIIFVCVPTLLGENNLYDLTNIRAAFGQIKDERDDEYTIVVVKSTVTPGTTRILQRENPQWSVLFSPEFLTERFACRDTREPARQIVGCCEDKPHLEAGRRVMEILPRAISSSVVSPIEIAEAVKLFANAFYALKVSYANQFCDYCDVNRIDYEAVRSLASGDPMMENTHLDVNQDNYRGFAGKCLPKDTAALLAASNGEMTLLSEALRYNESLKKK